MLAGSRAPAAGLIAIMRHRPLQAACQIKLTGRRARRTSGCISMKARLALHVETACNSIVWRSLLVECSVVATPANPAALRTEAKLLGVSDSVITKLIRSTHASWRGRRQRWRGQQPPRTASMRKWRRRPNLSIGGLSFERYPKSVGGLTYFGVRDAPRLGRLSRRTKANDGSR
jgi:hypothetical protein